jgi:lauroyl/myristoyl acyltransferase
MNLLRTLKYNCISYSTAVSIVSKSLDTRSGRRFSRSHAAELLRILSEAGIEHDLQETAKSVAMLELLFPWAYGRFYRHPQEFTDWVDVQGLQQLAELASSDKGILLAGNHCGPGYMVGCCLTLNGYVSHIINRRAKLQVSRSHPADASSGGSIAGSLEKISKEKITFDGLMRSCNLVRTLLSRGEIVHAALDGNVGMSNGLRLPLMGHERVFHMTLPLIAGLTHAVIIPVFTWLKPDGHIEIRFEQPLPERDPELAPLDYAEEITRNYANMLQKYWEQKPGSVRMKIVDQLVAGG